jgi:hypothetical protein
MFDSDAGSGGAGKSPGDLVTDAILGSAIAVHRELGPGLLESAYEACLAFELESRGLRVERQRSLPVVYRGVRVDCGYRMDCGFRKVWRGAFRKVWRVAQGSEVIQQVEPGEDLLARGGRMPTRVIGPGGGQSSAGKQLERRPGGQDRKRARGVNPLVLDLSRDWHEAINPGVGGRAPGTETLATSSPRRSYVALATLSSPGLR